MNERPRMTKAERDDLIRLIKQRERVAKTAAEQRSSAMLVEFEQGISAAHEFATNEVWSAATAAAVEAANEANKQISSEAARLGIPEEFRPKLHFTWQRRGENEYQGRREELRRVAKAEIETMERAAKVKIEAESVQAQTEIIRHGLNSETAIAFLENLDPVEALMPLLDLQTIQAKLAERARRAGLDRRHPYLVTDDT